MQKKRQIVLLGGMGCRLMRLCRIFAVARTLKTTMSIGSDQRTATTPLTRIFFAKCVIEVLAAAVGNQTMCEYSACQ
jgi:hypothetical protein